MLVTASAADASEEESAGSTYGTIQDSIVMNTVLSDSSDAEIASDDPNRQLVTRSTESSINVSAGRNTT